MDGPSFLSAELIVRWLDDVEDNVPPRPMPLWEPRVSFAEHVSHRTISDVSVSFTDLLISRM